MGETGPQGATGPTGLKGSTGPTGIATVVTISATGGTTIVTYGGTGGTQGGGGTPSGSESTSNS